MSRDLRMVEPAAPGETTSKSPDRTGERFQLDFVSWRARLAAPGSRFATPAPPVVHLDAVSRPAAASRDERGAA